MSVRKLKNGKWIADVNVGIKYDGTPDRRTKTCATKAEAQRAERAFYVKKDSSLISGKITIDDFIEDIYWPNKKSLRPNTVMCYKRDIKLRILPSLSGKYLENIKRYDIQQMISSCATRKVATNARETLSSILGLAVDLELLARNPASLRYDYPPAADHDPDHYGVWLTTFAEHKRFLEAIQERDVDPMLFRICVLGLCFGLRKGEIFGLDWEHVDLEKRVIRIEQTYVVGEDGAFLAEPKTKRSTRTIPMTSFAHNVMEMWDVDAKSGPIVRNRMGKRMFPGNGKDRLRAFMAKNPDLPRLTIHSMRHSFATSCIIAGVDVAKVSAWLGHREVSTTYNRYVKPLLDDLAEEVAVIDAAFG